VTALRHSADGLLHTRTHLEVFTTEVGLDLHKEKDQTTSRGLFVSMFNCFQVICPSARPSFRRSVRPSIHVPMSLNHATTGLLPTLLKTVQAWQLVWNQKSACHKASTYAGLHKYRNIANMYSYPECRSNSLSKHSRGGIRQTPHNARELWWLRLCL
jgi:hypothetical protein